METVQFQHLTVSRLILGSNPFSGFSHQSPEMDQTMRHYFTTARIKETLRQAESLGVNTLIARADFHVMRMLMEYRDEGGTLQWFAQTCPEVGSHEACILRAEDHGAKACHLHGGVMDNAFAQGKLDDVQPALDLIRSRGMLAGIAAHNHRVIEWAEEHLDLDYYLDLVRSLKSALPDVTLKCFTASEVHHITKLSGLTTSVFSKPLGL